MTLRSPGSILLISCYELGHQPHGVVLPLAFLERAGFAPVAHDVAVEPLDPDKITGAGFVGISVPMHTAMRLGVQVAARVREIHPRAHICFYGLYASLNSAYLLDNGADSCIGGECEGPLVALVEALESGARAPVPGVVRRAQPAGPFLEKLPFAVPSRRGLPDLEKYARLEHDGKSSVVGYTEATRGCRHLCTHCPIPPVYGGRFFVIPREQVLADIRNLVAAGATHVTFGDPDFLNGPKHSLRVIRAMNDEFPELTFDFTAKVQHLIQRGENLPEFAERGCLFIVSAVESLSERVLTILDKKHTVADVALAIERVHGEGITLRPTWVAFTPWTTRDDYREVLEFVMEHGLIDHVDPVQYAIRLLVPPGSWLAEHAEMLPHRGELDEARFSYRWTHPDPHMDRLHQTVMKLVESDACDDVDPGITFYKVCEAAGVPQPAVVGAPLAADRARAPRLSESWFC